MIGIEIAAFILGVYPVLIDTVRAYKAAKSSHSIDQLERKLRAEASIYKTFVTNLLACASRQEDNLEALRDEIFQNQLKESLGSDRVELILLDLVEMEKLLEALKTEISNVNRSSVGAPVPTCIPNENHRPATDEQNRNCLKSSGQDSRPLWQT